MHLPSEEATKQLQAYTQNLKLTGGHDINFAHGDKDVKRAMEEAPQIIDKILQDLATGKTPPLISYQDPDQSSLKTGYEGQLLKEKWCCGMDMPHGKTGLGYGYFTNWFMSIFLGNYDDFENILKFLPKDRVKAQLRMRESWMQFSAIFVVVAGAKIFWRQNMSQLEMKSNRAFYAKFERKHMQILKKLLEVGADVNVHDVAGYTPLHHCLTASSNDINLAMAKILLDHGANPNAVNRYGATPLMECVMVNDIEKIELMMKYKADPYIKDNDGTTPLELSRFFPGAYQRLRQGGDKAMVKKNREAASSEGNHKRCNRCNEKAEKRCLGCFLIWYCCKECQQTDWETHRKACKKIKSEYLPVEMIRTHKFQSSISILEGSVHHHSDDYSTMRPQIGQFVVKVQRTENCDQPLMVYNKARDVQYLIAANSELGSKLTKAIKESCTDGPGHYKGYFYSVVREKKHFIHPKVLPLEKW